MIFHRSEVPSKKVPVSRWSRLGHLGRLATHVSSQAIYHGSKSLLKGQVRSRSELLLTVSNVEKLAQHLSEMRGAAMKVGQLLSMENGDFIPEQFRLILASLRNQAHVMPLSQLNHVLVEEWGESWMDVFSQFSFQPIASASIGQVHKARLKNGQALAIKVQYPGVKDSIDSDVDNLASLLKWSGLLPKHLNVDALFNEAKIQLHQEADYHQEAAYLKRFYEVFSEQDRFVVPQYLAEWSTNKILTMSFEQGALIDQCHVFSTSIKVALVSDLIELFLKELFDMQLMQTDPNFANFLYSADDDRIVLLDFGATQRLSEKTVETYRQLMRQLVAGETELFLLTCQQMDYLPEEIPQDITSMLTQMVKLIEPVFKEDRAFDFSDQAWRSSLQNLGVELGQRNDFWHTPEFEVLLVHRKLIGLFMLATQFNVSVNVHRLINVYV